MRGSVRSAELGCMLLQVHWALAHVHLPSAGRQAPRVPNTSPLTPGLHSLWPHNLLVDTNNHTLSVNNYCC